MNTKISESEKNISFLHESQLAGRGSDKIPLEDWADALSVMHKILTPEREAHFKATDWENPERTILAIYCQDCHEIVPPEMRQIGRRMRAICGKCGSKKIASGRKEALIGFYHLEEKENGEVSVKPKENARPPRPKRDFHKMRDLESQDKKTPGKDNKRHSRPKK